MYAIKVKSMCKMSHTERKAIICSVGDEPPKGWLSSLVGFSDKSSNILDITM